MTATTPLLETVSVRHRRFTVEHIYAMLEAGVLTEDDRVELIEGELLNMNPNGSRHSACVNRMVHLFQKKIREDVIISVQNPLRLDAKNEPQPDIALLRPRDDYYEKSHPGPADVRLIIEVTDSSLAFDNQVITKLYARHGIPEFWLVDVDARSVEICREPTGGAYARVMKMDNPDSTLAPLAFGDAVLRLKDMLG